MWTCLLPPRACAWWVLSKPSSSLPFVNTCFPPSSPLNPGLSLYWGLQWVDAASTFDLSVPRQGLVGAVIHGFQVSQLHRCAWEFSSYRLGKYSRAGCLPPLEEWAQNQASPCLATPGCSFQPEAPCQPDSGEENVTSAHVLPSYTEHNKSFQDDLLS